MNIPPKYEDVVAQLEAALHRESLSDKHLGEALDREAALREELDAEILNRGRADVLIHKLRKNSEVEAKHLDRMIEAHDSLQQRLTVAEQRAEMLEREFKKLRDVAHDCYQIASSYSGCIDGVEESGGDDHDDPSCAIFHRLYYAMFDADRALKPAEEGEGS